MNEMIDNFTIKIKTPPMSDFQFADAILDETVFLLPDVAKLTISSNNANDTNVINLNKVSTVLVFSEENADESSNPTIIAMHKMAAALKLANTDYAMVNLHLWSDFSIRHLWQHPGITHLICLGISLSHLGLHIENELYKPLLYNNLNIITSHSIVVITPDNKKLLWGRLQTMYQIK